MNTKIHPLEYRDSDTGWYVTDDEAYTPEEWAEEAKTCGMCGTEFVVYSDSDAPAPRGAYKFCSDRCKLERHRQQSRDFNRMKAARAATSG